MVHRFPLKEEKEKEEQGELGSPRAKGAWWKNSRGGGGAEKLGRRP